MHERDDIDRRDEDETAQPHPRRCGCIECDPDFYFDPAELRAPREEERFAPDRAAKIGAHHLDLRSK